MPRPAASQDGPSPLLRGPIACAGTGRFSSPTCIWERKAARRGSSASSSPSRALNAILRSWKRARAYLPGNHDEASRSYCGLVLAGIELRREAPHQTTDGLRLLVIHDDHFDGIVT